MVRKFVQLMKTASAAGWSAALTMRDTTSSGTEPSARSSLMPRPTAFATAKPLSSKKCLPRSVTSGTYGPVKTMRRAPTARMASRLAVDDVVLAVTDLRSRGVDVSDPFHFGQNGQTPGVHPGTPRPDFGTYAQFADPDGNVWLLQEVPSRAGKAWGLS